MARANRHHLYGYVWHITHRCHKREFLLKFNRDKRRWRHWLFEAKKRYGLTILNYTVTSNHIHLLALDTKRDVIPQSIQLIAGRTGREFNIRKQRRGAFWEDRYHATAVASGRHLARCLVYIDMNMVRAGIARHPSEWEFGGYSEIQHPKRRYTIIDRQALKNLFGMKDDDQLSESHRNWVEDLLKSGSNTRDAKWTESIAVGDEQFVSNTKRMLGAKAAGRRIIGHGDSVELRESKTPYNHVFAHEKSTLRLNNTYFFQLSPDKSRS